jgi:hypothetical protein
MKPAAQVRTALRFSKPIRDEQLPASVQRLLEHFLGEPLDDNSGG